MLSMTLAPTSQLSLTSGLKVDPILINSSVKQFPELVKGLAD